MRENRNVRRSFYLGLSTIFILLVLFGAFKIRMTNKTIETNRVITHTFQVISEVQALSNSYHEQRIKGYEYLLTGDYADPDVLRADTETFHTHISNLLQFTKDNAVQQQLLTQLQIDFDAMIAASIEPILQIRQGILDKQVESATIKTLLGSLKLQADELDSVLKQINRIEYGHLTELQATVSRWNKIDRWSTYLISALIIITFFIFGMRALYRLARYQKAVKENQQMLAETKNRMENIITGSHLGSWEWDLKTNDLTINHIWAEILGYSLAELGPITYETFLTLVHPDDVPHVQEIIKAHIAGERSLFVCDMRMKHKDGHWVWIYNRGQIIKRDEDGYPLIMTGTHADITERVTQAQAIARSEEENRKLFETMNQGFAYCQVIFDEAGEPNDYRILRVNKNIELQTGLIPSEIAGKKMSEVVPFLEPFWMDYHRQVALTGKSSTIEGYNNALKRYLRISSFSPEYGYFGMIIDDISPQKQMESQLFYEKTLFETTLLSVGDGVISTDDQGNVQFMNVVAEQLTGWKADEAKGTPFEEVFKIVGGKNRHVCQSPVQLALEIGKTVELEDDCILIARDGFERFVSDSAAPILNVDNKITGVVLVFRDSTASKKKQEEIHTLSITDSLTTLPNRRYYDQVRQNLKNEPYAPMTLVLADINGLKLTNDAFGHKTGDELLRKVANTIKANCREGDIVSRVGGDEFILMLPRTDIEYAQVVLDRINGALQKEEIKGMHLSVSFGVAVHESDMNNYDDTFKIAEDAMYRNKLRESNAYKKQVIETLLNRLFDLTPGIQTHSETVSFLSAKLGKALGLHKEKIQDLSLAGLYHDLGKIAISVEILNSNEEELSYSQKLELQRHTEIGYNILRSVGEYATFAEAVLYHHERWDGSGYPQNLKREAIPVEAQIVAIANTYADLTEHMDTKQAKAYLKDRSNTAFDPILLDIFINKVLSTN